MKAEVYDIDDKDDPGIQLHFDLENGMGINIFMDDERAQVLIDLIQNKLNARML